VIPDGTYDAMVVDATATGAGEVLLELAIVSGAHRGDVVAVRARGVDRTDVDLLGELATLTVVDGTPAVTFGP
jgi:hypothetical protein